MRSDGEQDEQRLKLRAGSMVAIAGLSFLKPSEKDIDTILDHFGGIICFPRNTLRLSRISEPMDKEENSAETCPICIREFDGSEVKLKACGHVFCESCVEAWVNESLQANCHKCPMCRTDLEDTVS